MINAGWREYLQELQNSLLDEDPRILDSGARLQKKIKASFKGFIEDMERMFEIEKDVADKKIRDNIIRNIEVNNIYLKTIF